MGTEFRFREVKPWETMMVMAVHQCERLQCHWTEQLHMVKTVGFILRDFTKIFFKMRKKKRKSTSVLT